MFKERIAKTPLTTNAANKFFGDKVVGNSYLDDNTFLSTLRAIVYPKMNDGETLSLAFKESGYRIDQTKAYKPSDVVYGVSFLGSNFNADANGIIRIHCFNSRQLGDGAQVCFDIVKDNFEKIYSDAGWKQLPEVTMFFKKIFPVLCFVNPKIKSTFMFVVDIDIRRLHFMQAAVFAYLPWYFDREKPLSDTELELINTLTKKGSATAENYLRCLQKIADDYNFRELEIRKLHDFEMISIKRELENSKVEEQRIRNNIQDLNARIFEAIEQLTNKQTMIMGLEQKVNSGGESELMEYFLCNKNLILRESGGDEIIFSVKEYLDYFDEDMAKAVIDNERSYVYYSRTNDDIGNEDIKKLMEAIFVTRELKARLCATYKINLYGNARAISDFEYGSEFDGYMPNIHLDKYSCLGNYAPILNELLAEHEYIGAIEQCIASCKSLNFGDSTVMGYFMTVIHGGGYRGKKWRFIELPNGSVVTAEKAVEYLNNREEFDE